MHFWKRNLLAAFSWASIICLPFWIGIFEGRQTPFGGNFASNHYFLPFDHQFDFLLGLAVMSGLTILAFLVLQWVQKSAHRVHEIVVDSAFLLSVILMLNFVRTGYWPELSAKNIQQLIISHVPEFVVGAILLSIVVWAAAPLCRKMLRMLMPIGTAIGVISGINAAGAILVLWPYSVVPMPDMFPLAKTLEADSSRPLVVWMIFDEFDYRLGFEDRPDDLQMPNFDGLRHRSFHGTMSYPPADGTVESMVSLSLGRHIDLQDLNWRNLEVSDVGSGKPARWSELKTIFSEVHDRKMNVGILGQAIPYCRLLNNVITNCYEFDRNWAGGVSAVLGRVGFVVSKTLGNFPGAARLASTIAGTSSNVVYEHYANAILAADTFSRRSEMDFILLHWAIPHTPYVWDRKREEYTTPTSEPRRYPDALAHADFVLGKVMASLRDTTERRRVVTIVSADHAWANSHDFDSKTDRRVPFIVNFSDTSASLEFDGELTTLMTASIIDGVFNGRINDPASLRDYIVKSQPGLLESPPPIKLREPRE